MIKFNLKSLLLNSVIFFLISSYTAIAENNGANTSTWINYSTKNILNNINNEKINYHNSIGTEIKYKQSNLIANLSFILKNNQNLKFDNSYIDYTFKNTTVGFGKVNRIWSYSPHSSLFLSKNARPSDTVYLITKNKSKWLGNWSAELFNGIQKNSLVPMDANLLGARITINPIEPFEIEFIKMSQWGGKKYSNNMDSFFAAVLGNSNEGPNSKINQLAGIGFSYTSPDVKIPFKLYGQVAGEDESGSLPSCYSHLFGFITKSKIMGLKTSYGMELIDTRTKKTSHGYCGANSMYNNKYYQYTNYDKVMGAAIDTESKSLKLWAKNKLSDNLQINYSITGLTVNDKNWKYHRLSSKKVTGWQKSINLEWKRGSVSVNGGLYHQDISLNKANIPKQFSVNLYSVFKF